MAHGHQQSEFNMQEGTMFDGVLRKLKVPETTHRISAALLFITFAQVAGNILRIADTALLYYLLATGLAMVLVVLVRQLGDTPFLRDLQEICFYDVLVAIFGFCVNQPGQKPVAFWILSSAVAYLKIVRILWVGRNAQGEIYASWPVFGLLGLLGQRWQPAAYPVKAKLQVYLACAVAIITPICIWLALGRIDNTFYALAIVVSLISVVKPIVDNIETTTAERDKLTRENAILEARAEMAAQIAERNADLCHATHDCKSPVLALLNTAEALQHSTDPEVTRTTAQHLVSGLHELGDLLSEIIVMAKVTTEAVAPDADVVDMQALAWRVGELLDDEAHKRKVMLAIDDAPFCVKSNKWLLTRIITNLVTNAIVHGDRKTRVRLGIYRRGNFCYIYVWDTGRGIPNANGPDRAANFTNLLQVVHRRPNPAASYADNVLSGGHGLGLKSVMRMCNTLGITMTLISKPGWGTKFRFRVPLAGPDEKPHMIMAQDLFALAQASQSSPPKT